MERLDPHLAHPAYLCGRLFAIYEGLQYSAFRAGAPSNSTPGPSVTVGDRYFTLASTFPQAVFPRLESLGKAHLKKLRRENPRAMSAIAGRITTLTSHMGPDGYPGQLSLQDQGRFIVGYHHQKAEEGRQAALARAAREAAGSAAPAESTPAEFATIQ